MVDANPALASMLLARLESEGLIPLAEAAALLPGGRQGKRRHVRTLIRWAVQGGRGGVRLEAVRLENGRWYTSRHALERYRLATSRVPRAEVRRLLLAEEAAWAAAQLRRLQTRRTGR